MILFKLNTHNDSMKNPEYAQFVKRVDRLLVQAYNQRALLSHRIDVITKANIGIVFAPLDSDYQNKGTRTLFDDENIIVYVKNCLHHSDQEIRISLIHEIQHAFKATIHQMHGKFKKPEIDENHSTILIVQFCPNSSIWFSFQIRLSLKCILQTKLDTLNISLRCKNKKYTCH